MENTIQDFYCLLGKDKNAIFPLKGENILENKQDPIWIHFQQMTPEAEKWILSHTKMPKHIILAMTSLATRPRMIEEEDGFFVSIRGVHLKDSCKAEDMLSIRIWVEEKRIVTFCMTPQMSIQKLVLAKQQGKVFSSCLDFFEQIAKTVLVYLEPLIASLDEVLETMEEILPDINEKESIDQISELRKEAFVLKRYIMPQKEVLFQVMHAKYPWMTKQEKKTLEEIIYRQTFDIEDLDAITSRIQIINDEFRHRLQQQNSRLMYMFSVFAVLFLPLTFCTGLFGINVGGIPFAHSPWGFSIFVATMVVIFFSMIFVFRRIKWM